MPPKKKLVLPKDDSPVFEIPDGFIIDSEKTPEGITSRFKLLIQHVQSSNDKAGVFKIREYMDTINIMNDFPADMVFNFENVKTRFKEFGKKNPVKILAKIQEYFDKGFITEAEEIRNDPRMKQITLFMDIHGIGPKKAIELVDEKHISSIEQLKSELEKNPKLLNAKQVLGLTYYEDLQERIPRMEIDIFKGIVETAIKLIDSKAQISINGSYRRGLETSGDIDLLITTTSKEKTPEQVRLELIEELKKADVIREDLASGAKKYMGIIRVISKFRHLDIMSTSAKEFPFAQLYFTGSKKFNTIMRAHALSKGYSLNEYGLTDKLTGIKVKGDFESEKDIFDFLDMKWKTPEERNL